MEMVITTKVTYKYLMSKSKHELAQMVLDLLDREPDPRRPSPRAAVQPEQICPSCDGVGTSKNQLAGPKCIRCNGTGKSERSVGG